MAPILSIAAAIERGAAGDGEESRVAVEEESTMVQLTRGGCKEGVEGGRGCGGKAGARVSCENVTWPGGALSACLQCKQDKAEGGASAAARLHDPPSRKAG